MPWCRFNLCFYICIWIVFHLYLDCSGFWKSRPTGLSGFSKISSDRIVRFLENIIRQECPGSRKSRPTWLSRFSNFVWQDCPGSRKSRPTGLSRLSNNVWQDCPGSQKSRSNRLFWVSKISSHRIVSDLEHLIVYWIVLVLENLIRMYYSGSPKFHLTSLSLFSKMSPDRISCAGYRKSRTTYEILSLSSDNKII